MFGLFGKKDKKKSKTAESSAASDEHVPTSSESVREAALAQFRTTQAELGEETIQAMQKALEFEEAKRKIRDAVDNKEGYNMEAVLVGLKELAETAENADTDIATDKEHCKDDDTEDKK